MPKARRLLGHDILASALIPRAGAPTVRLKLKATRSHFGSWLLFRRCSLRYVLVVYLTAYDRPPQLMLKRGSRAAHVISPLRGSGIVHIRSLNCLHQFGIERRTLPSRREPPCAYTGSSAIH